MRKEEIKQAKFIVKKGWIKKVNPVIKEGDIILVDFTSKPLPNNYAFYAFNEKNWIEKYKKPIKGVNIYPIITVTITN